MVADPAPPSETPDKPSSALVMYTIVRGDLKKVSDGKITVGKLIGQGQHAALHSALSAPLRSVAKYDADPNHGKIVLKGRDEAHLRELLVQAERGGIPYHLVTDFGHTVFKDPTVTMLGIGPVVKEYAQRMLDIADLPLY